MRKINTSYIGLYSRPKKEAIRFIISWLLEILSQANLAVFRNKAIIKDPITSSHLQRLRYTIPCEILHHHHHHHHHHHRHPLPQLLLLGGLVVQWLGRRTCDQFNRSWVRLPVVHCMLG